MKIQEIACNFSVCKVTNLSEVDYEQEYLFIGKTDEEISLIGILARITTLLAENKNGIFAVSTYNTDYLLVKEENYGKALKVLADAGYQIV